jgi:transcriptional regulator of arginine metabolism
MDPWRDTLTDLIESGRYRTQGELASELSRRGNPVDQSTISRTLRALGVRKQEGVYCLPAAPALGAPVHSLAAAHGGAVAVLKTDPAFASVIARQLDDAALPGVLGTLAGDDTVFVALSAPDALTGLARFVGRPLPVR